jgi:hypothetical protein
MTPIRRFAAALSLVCLVLPAACKDDGDDLSGPPVTTPLECGQPGATDCGLPLTSQSSFTVTITSIDCEARDNKIRVTAPVSDELTDDACYEDVGKAWTFPGPFAAGSQLNFEIESRQLRNAASLRASGTYPTWTLTFEDGGDQDFNDIVLQVTATATP